MLQKSLQAARLSLVGCFLACPQCGEETDLSDCDAVLFIDEAITESRQLTETIRQAVTDLREAGNVAENFSRYHPKAGSALVETAAHYRALADDLAALISETPDNA